MADSALGSAEAIKGEIYRYRAGAGIYSDEACVADSAQSKLAAKVRELSSTWCAAR